MDFIDILDYNQHQQEQGSSNIKKIVQSIENKQYVFECEDFKTKANSNQIHLPTFRKDINSSSNSFYNRFVKFQKYQRNTYQINVAIDIQKQQICIDVSPLTQQISSLSTSYQSTLHLITLFSILNASSVYDFKIHPTTLQITISFGFVVFSKNIDYDKIDSIINNMIITFQKNYSQIKMFAQGKYFFNDKSIVLCQPAQKCIRITQEILTDSCFTLTQIAVTKNYQKQTKQQNKQQKKPNKLTKSINTIHKAICSSDMMQTTEINVKDLQRLLIPQKQSGNKALNSVCAQIKIKQHNNLKWVNFVSNRNSKLEIADAELNFRDAEYVSKRTIVRKTPRTQNGLKQLENSKIIYNSLKQKNCVNILKSYALKNDQNQQNIYSDFCRYGSLSNYINKNKRTISLKTKLYFLLQIASGLQFLQSQKIIHMDIKPSNILVATDLWIKITDFGQAIFQGENKLKGWTAPYVATQVLNNKQIDFKADIYSFGVTAYQVLTGKLLFQRRPSTMQNFSQIFKSKYPNNNIYPESMFKHGPREIMFYLYHLIMRCVNPIKNCRLNIEQIILILKSLIGLVQYLTMVN